MLKWIGRHVWLQQAAVAVAYALAYTLLRQVSFSHWALFAGFRLSVLLLVPYRYWPALAVGEAGPLAYTGIECVAQYGWIWAIYFTMPPILFAMPIARWCRERRRLFPAMGTTNINVLLLCALTASVVWTVLNAVSLLLMRLPPGEAPSYREAIGLWIIGNYLGILTLVPLVLLVREEMLKNGRRRIWVRLSESGLLMETAYLLLPALALLVWLASDAPSSSSEEARVAMFLPVAWFALRHGWYGAAIGGTAASLAVVLAMPALYDNETVQAQVFIAFTISTMLLLGGRIAVLREREEREKAESRLAFAAAQRNIYLGEMKLRRTSLALEQMSAAIHTSYTQLLGRLHYLLPGMDERRYYRQAAVAQHQMYRLADSLYPLVWHERGLAAALRESSMPRALDEAGIVYRCDIGPKLDDLSTGVHLALYRLTCEAVALACSKRNVSHIHVRLRGGSFRGRRWGVLCVDGLVDYGRLSRVRWHDLLSALDGSGLGMDVLKDRATVFAGKVRMRSLPQGERISLILFDPDVV